MEPKSKEYENFFHILTLKKNFGELGLPISGARQSLCYISNMNKIYRDLRSEKFPCPRQNLLTIKHSVFNKLWWEPDARWRRAVC